GAERHPGRGAIGEVCGAAPDRQDDGRSAGDGVEAEQLAPEMMGGSAGGEDPGVATSRRLLHRSAPIEGGVHDGLRAPAEAAGLGGPGLMARKISSVVRRGPLISTSMGVLARKAGAFSVISRAVCWSLVVSLLNSMVP